MKFCKEYSSNFLWGIFFTEILLIALGAFGKILYFEYATHLLVAGFMTLLILVVLLVMDAACYCKQYKWFWIVTMVLMAPFATLFYLIQRDDD